MRDEGEGIPPEFLPLVFEPLRQRESRRVHRHAGLGLGLFIARTLVTIHGGTITAESAGLGRGASFTIALPRAVADQDGAVEAGGDVTQPVAAWAQTGESPLAGLQVLVVDDHAPTREALAAALERHGAKVAVADSAAGGRAAVAAAAPDVLISDIAMPDEDGCTFMRRLRIVQAASRQPRPLAALALSAHAAGEDARRALDAGFDRFLAKPVAPDRLVATVAELAGRRRLNPT